MTGSVSLFVLQLIQFIHNIQRNRRYYMVTLFGGHFSFTTDITQLT